MKKPSNAKWYEYEMDKYEDMVHAGAEGKMCGEVPERVILAHSYVPWQCYTKAFSPSEALMKGTLFPELWGVYPIPE
ncbi:MAG: spore coat associated protein CotJA [Negativicutes bacterium]|nr:spore coat associated protein CotJA [Negativicutes bacterium]